MEKQADVNMTFESFVALYERDIKPKLKLNTWLTKESIIQTEDPALFCQAEAVGDHGQGHYALAERDSGDAGLSTASPCPKLTLKPFTINLAPFSTMLPDFTV